MEKSFFFFYFYSHTNTSTTAIARRQTIPQMESKPNQQKKNTQTQNKSTIKANGVDDNVDIEWQIKMKFQNDGIEWKQLMMEKKKTSTSKQNKKKTIERKNELMI